MKKGFVTSPTDNRGIIKEYTYNNILDSLKNHFRKEGFKTDERWDYYSRRHPSDSRSISLCVYWD